MDELNQLVQKCIRNHRPSQEKLYKKFYPALFTLCRRLVRDDQEALEALNDGMLKIFRNLNQFDLAKGSLFNWMYTVIRHTAIDHLKQKKWINFTSLDDGQFISDPDTPLKVLEDREIYQHLEILSPATRIVGTQLGNAGNSYWSSELWYL